MQVPCWVLVDTMAKHILNASVEIVPSLGEDFEVRTSLFGTKIGATRYQVGLLQQFEQAAVIEERLQKLPFEQKESTRFLEQCLAKAILLETDASGEAIFPKRVLSSSNFANTPHFDPAEPAAYTFLGVPFDGLTTGNAGARFGPNSIRAASSGTRYRLDPHHLVPYGFYDYASAKTILKEITLSDAGDVFYAPGESTADFFARVSDVVREICDAGSIPIIMGGDHSITWPVMRALPHTEFGILHFDAHTDLGEAMPGTQLHHGSVFTHVLEKLEYVGPLVQFGLRGIIDASEHIESKEVVQFGMEQLKDLSVEEMLKHIPDDRPYYLSIDIDVVDPAYAPSTGTPVPNGMLPSDLKSLVHTLARHRELIAIDAVEVGLCTNVHDSTGGVAMEVLLSAADGLVCGLENKIDSPE